MLQVYLEAFCGISGAHNGSTHLCHEGSGPGQQLAQLWRPQMPFKSTKSAEKRTKQYGAILYHPRQIKSEELNLFQPLCNLIRLNGPPCYARWLGVSL